MKQDVINCCLDQGVATFRAVNEEYQAFEREIGAADKLPKKFALASPAMKALVDDIDQAILDGDLQKTEDLCDEWRRRFTAFLNGWRAKMAQKKEAA